MPGKSEFAFATSDGDVAGAEGGCDRIACSAGTQPVRKYCTVLYSTVQECFRKCWPVSGWVAFVFAGSSLWTLARRFFKIDPWRAEMDLLCQMSSVPVARVDNNTGLDWTGCPYSSPHKSTKDSRDLKHPDLVFARGRGDLLPLQALQSSAYR